MNEIKSFNIISSLLNEKAKSIKQQQLFGIVHAVQKGDMKAPSKDIAKMAKSIKKTEVEKFAKTKHKGLPKKIKKKK